MLKATSLPFRKQTQGTPKKHPWVRTLRHDHCSECYTSQEGTHPCLVYLGSVFGKLVVLFGKAVEGRKNFSGGNLSLDLSLEVL